MNFNIYSLMQCATQTAWLPTHALSLAYRACFRLHSQMLSLFPRPNPSGLNLRRRLASLLPVAGSEQERLEIHLIVATREQHNQPLAEQRGTPGPQNQVTTILTI